MFLGPRGRGREASTEASGQDESRGWGFFACVSGLGGLCGGAGKVGLAKCLTLEVITGTGMTYPSSACPSRLQTEPGLVLSCDPRQPCSFPACFFQASRGPTGQGRTPVMPPGEGGRSYFPPRQGEAGLGQHRRGLIALEALTRGLAHTLKNKISECLRQNHEYRPTGG